MDLQGKVSGVVFALRLSHWGTSRSTMLFLKQRKRQQHKHRKQQRYYASKLTGIAAIRFQDIPNATGTTSLLRLDCQRTLCI